MAWKYNPKTNRWEQEEVPVPQGQDVSAGDGKPWTWSDIPTTTAPKRTTTTSQAPTTTQAPKTTQAPTTTQAPKNTAAPTTTVPKTTTTKKTGRFEGGVRPKRGQFPGAKENQQLDPKTLSDVMSELLGGGNDALYNLLLGGAGGSGGSSGPTTAQRVSAAKKANRQTTAMANKYYGQQQQQANDAIRNATLEFLANIPQSTAYQQAPLVSMPPELQGLQQQLLSYGATGQDAMTQQSQDAAAANMYQALARQGAAQLGSAEQGYLDALRRAGQGGQAAGLAGVAGNIADFKNQLALQNLQALIQAQTS